VTSLSTPHLVADGFTFPTSLAFDEAGTMYVAEAGLPFGGARPGGRVWRVETGGEQVLVSDDLPPPVNGLSHHGGALLVSVGGHPSGIVRLSDEGSVETVVEGLPGPGNYQTNMAVVGPDEKLYFSQGAMTNSGIIGLDAYEIGWLARLPHSHDLPGFEVELTGVNVRTPNPLVPGNGEVETGAFVPFGTATRPGQRIRAHLPATAAVMRCELDGSALELVAWGLRNAYGLGFLPDGRLLAMDQGADDRGSRPIGNAPDLLYEIHPGSWYGWPDFIGGEPVIDARFRPQRGPAPTFVLANHHELPPPQRPLISFPPHAAAVKFDVSPAGDLIVALFGDEAPMTAPPGERVGRGIVRVDLEDRLVEPLGVGPFARPIDVRFSPDGVLHVLDFGRFEMTERGVEAEPGTGRVYGLAPGWGLRTAPAVAANAGPGTW
jgi:glucose/arabinose dehydrogenase